MAGRVRPLSPLYFLSASANATAIAVATMLGRSLRASRTLRHE